MTSPDDSHASQDSPVHHDPAPHDPSGREAAIRARAHARWESEGRPEGRAEDHWLEAERSLGDESPAGGKPDASGETDDDMPPAGPHARPELTNPDATAGSGMLPAIGADEDPNAQPSG